MGRAAIRIRAAIRGRAAIREDTGGKADNTRPGFRDKTGCVLRERARE